MRVTALFLISLLLTAVDVRLPAIPGGIDAAFAQTRTDRIRSRLIERRDRAAERAQRLQRLKRLESARRLERARLRRWIEFRRSRTLDEHRMAATEGRLMRSPRGGWRVRGEILSAALSPAALERLRLRGFELSRRRQLPALGIELVVLRAPGGQTDAEALALARDLAPKGRFALHHLLDPSGSRDVPDLGRFAGGGLPWSSLPMVSGAALGLIDLGVDTDHPALADAQIDARGFAADGALAPSRHGTAVASLLVGQLRDFRGSAHGAQLYAADVFGEAKTGGSVEAILAALDWMTSKRVPVIAIPLVGPHNPLLEVAIETVADKGAIIVAPVGNDGPTEPVAYPAAYPSVVAVTATDRDGSVFVAAHRGPEVLLAAVGVALPAAADPAELTAVEGTSFAVPEVAARLLHRYGRLRNPSRAQDAIAALREQAADLGAPGRDPVYGEGWVSFLGVRNRVAEYPSVPPQSPEKE